jgi:hypothetical protein
MLSQSFEVLSWTAVPIGKAAPTLPVNDLQKTAQLGA